MQEKPPLATTSTLRHPKEEASDGAFLLAAIGRAWTVGLEVDWARLHETVPYDPPTPELADEIATRFARLISVCQPIVESLREEVPLPIEAPVAARKPRRFGARKARA